MKNYYIEVPVVMKLMVGVKAECEEKAKEKVLGGEIEIDVKVDEEQFHFIDWEWDMHEQVVQGNVFHGVINEIFIDEED